MAATRTAAAYCAEADINLGDLQTPRAVSIEDWIKSTADEIDAEIGQVYKLPLSFDLTKPEDRADALYLKRINSFLATARIILLIAGGREDATLHAYGKSLLGDAKGALNKIVNKTVLLESAQLIGDADDQYNGPMIANKDAKSFVDSFYSSKGVSWNGGASA